MEGLKEGLDCKVQGRESFPAQAINGHFVEQARIENYQVTWICLVGCRAKCGLLEFVWFRQVQTDRVCQTYMYARYHQMSGIFSIS